MNATTCSYRPVLNQCTLENFDYQVDPYIGCGHYCYYCYALNEAKTDWTKEILTHKDITSQLNKELSAIPPQRIYMGWQTDPYQPCEAEYRQTRQVLELLLKRGFSASILTKSNLVLRDMDVFNEMNSASVSVSVAFNDNEVRQKFESNTIDTEARITALRNLKEAGINTSALICPVIPFITEVKPLTDMLVPYTNKIWIYGLSIQNSSDQNWQNITNILNRYFPGEKEQIEEIIFAKEYRYWTELRQDLMALKKDKQLNLSIHL